MNFARPSRRALPGVGGLTLLVGCAVESRLGPLSPAVVSPTDAITGSPFDVLYNPGFRLSPSSVDPIDIIVRPERFTGLLDVLTDPIYRTRLYCVTAAIEGGGGRTRHEYSRRQASNADASRYLIQDGRGFWHLYDVITSGCLRKFPDLVNDCEPLWHSGEPSRLYFIERNSGTV